MLELNFPFGIKSNSWSVCSYRFSLLLYCKTYCTFLLGKGQKKKMHSYEEFVLEGTVPSLSSAGIFKQSMRSTLLQGLTFISGTQTGCHRLDSYIEQKNFLACGPEYSVEFSAPPEFSGSVPEK